MKKIIYFVPVPETAEDLKKAYRALAFTHHPDKNGDLEIMKIINLEFEILFEKLKDTHRSAAGETYTSSTKSNEVPEDFIKIIEELIRFENIVIEICGCFLWISGDTKPIREILKKLKFRFHSKKKTWYLKPDWYIKRGAKQYSMNEIRSMWGSQTVEQQEQNQHVAINA